MNKDDVERFLASHPYSLATRDTYRHALLELLNLPDLAVIDAAKLVGFIQSRPGWGNSQQYVALCACRKFLAWQFGVAHAALSARIKRVRPRRQRTLTAVHALDLLASFDSRTPKGCRDLAIAALGLDTGLRCSEFCHLQLADVDLATRMLQVVIKGGQWGAGVFSPETAQYIREWIAVRHVAEGVGELFVSTRTGLGMTRCGLNCVVRKWGVRIGLKLSPHDLRRSFATLSTIFGAPSRVVQAAGRWSDIAMVEHYTQGLDPAAITPYLPVTRLNK
jgi:site-specific recombinase XerC